MDANFRVRINVAALHHCAPDWSWDTGRHPHRDYDLWAVMAGRGRLATPRGSFDVGPGDLFVLRPRERYVGSQDPDNRLSVLACHFDFVDSRGEARMPPESDLPPFHGRPADFEWLRHLLERMLADWMGAPRRADHAARWLETALLEVDRDRNRDIRPAGPGRERAERLDRLCAAIRKYPGRTYRVAEMALLLHCTPRHFARLFRSHTGLSPTEFVLRTRMEAARGMLRNSSHSVGRIADLLGYGDVYFFSRQFKARVGVSPTAFREG